MPHTCKSKSQNERNDWNQRVGGKGIDVQPTRTSDMQSHRGERSCNIQSSRVHIYITYVHIQAMTIKKNGDKDNMLKDDQDNMQARESSHQFKWYTTVNLYMWGE